MVVTVALVVPATVAMFAVVFSPVVPGSMIGEPTIAPLPFTFHMPITRWATPFAACALMSVVNVHVPDGMLTWPCASTIQPLPENDGGVVAAVMAVFVALEVASATPGANS